MIWIACGVIVVMHAAMLGGERYGAITKRAEEEDLRSVCKYCGSNNVEIGERCKGCGAERSK